MPNRPTHMNARREFIRSLALAATVVGARPALASLNPAGRSSNSAPASLRFEDFARLQGAYFRVSGKGVDSHWVQLDQVRESSRDPRLESFSLRFRGPATIRLPEHTYRFAHAEAGAFDLFVSPGADEGDHSRYQAIVCRLA